MLKLLRAGFSRLWKCRILWLCMAAAFVVSSLFLLKMSGDGENNRTLDEVFMQFLPFLPILYAVFSGLFLGLEYQEGTMRNKLIAGHTRAAVYYSQLLTAMAGCLAILLAWGMSIAVGAVKFGWFTAPGRTLLQAAVILLTMAATAAVLTLLAMLITNRAVSAVAAILAVFALLLLGSYFYNALCEPEMLSAAVMTETGFEVGEPMPNPNYIGGTLRKVYQFLADALPSGQAILLANGELMRPGLSMCASAGIVLLTVLGGLPAFKKKDLK